MASCKHVCETLKRSGFVFHTGVPCSILKGYVDYVRSDPSLEHVTATSEGEACAIASGYHLATGGFPVVYMQNSGEGNCVNPLTSLLDGEVYCIPTLLLVSWRGEPGTKDEPEHTKMGRITVKLLETLEIPFSVLPEDAQGVEKAVSEAAKHLKEEGSPYAILVRRGVIDKYEKAADGRFGYAMTREEALKLAVESMDERSVVVSTTGETSRELFEHTAEKGRGHGRNFYTIGSMGCAAGIALGIALKKPGLKVYVFDGDGAVLMKMGTLASIGRRMPANLYHIVFDNESYGSTGAQPTASSSARLDKVALGCGYRGACMVSEKTAFIECLENMRTRKGPFMLVVKVAPGSRKGLGRPTTTPAQNKRAFMDYLKKRGGEQE